MARKRGGRVGNDPWRDYREAVRGPPAPSWPPASSPAAAS